MNAQLTFADVAIDPLADAIAWRDANPAAFDQLVEWARTDQRAGYRPAVDLYFNLLRRPHFARALGMRATGGPYLANNNLRSAVARLVMREYPDVVFELRRAKHDPPAAPNARPQVVTPRP